MEAARSRYELRVGTHVSPATLASFRVPVRPIVVPRQTQYRFRVPADRDLSDVLDRLIERDVQVLEIRECPTPPPRGAACGPGAAEEPREQSGEADPTEDGVVVPFRAPPRSGRPEDDPPPAGSPSRRPASGSAGDLPAG